jgi:hypothetical protein
LYSETLPPTIGASSARQASAMPRTASVSCQAMCGFSGLPKFRLFVVPSGSAPTHARLAAHSKTDADRAVVRVARDPRPLPSIDVAMPRPFSSARTAASACSGRRTVRDCTSQSYC